MCFIRSDSANVRHFKASALRDNIDQWQRIGASEAVLDTLRSGVSLPFNCQKDNVAYHLRSRPIKKDYLPFVQSEIIKLQTSGVLQECNPSDLQVISPISVVPKKNKKSRLIHDNHVLNSYISPPKFKQDDIKTVLEYIKPNDLMISVDLKDGFYHIPIAKSDQKFLGFQHAGKAYHFTSLMFGLNASPYYFHKVLREVVKYLRQCGLRVVLYVDDFLLLSQPDEMDGHKQLFLDTLESLGLLINYEKSMLEPSMASQFIGYDIITGPCLEYPVIKIPAARLRKLRHDINRCLKLPQVTAWFLARICGQCVSMSRAIMPGKLMLRNAYRLLNCRTSWQSYLTLDSGTRHDLSWWNMATYNWNGRQVTNRPVTAQLVTDASSTGYGGVLNSRHEVAGFWDRDMAHRPSNTREAMAVLLSLSAFKDQLAHQKVHILSDNTATIANLNNMGGPSPELCRVAKAIWALCLELDIEISLSHIRGVLNSRSDRLSRLPVMYEWSLHPSWFHRIESRWGPHSIDRFATLANALLPKFNSRYLEPGSDGIDALSQQDWGQHNNFVNPPFCLIPNVLRLIRAQKAEATIIAPWWPAAPWHQLLLSMAKSSPLRIPMCAVSNPLAEPQKNRKWRLLAWRVCG